MSKFVKTEKAGPAGPAPLLTAIICNLIVNNGLSRLKISHTYDTMIPEKCLCKQFAKLEFFRVKEHLYEIRWIWFIRK